MDVLWISVSSSMVLLGHTSLYLHAASVSIHINILALYRLYSVTHLMCAEIYSLDTNCVETMLYNYIFVVDSFSSAVIKSKFKLKLIYIAYSLY